MQSRSIIAGSMLATLVYAGESRACKDFDVRLGQPYGTAQLSPPLLPALEVPVDAWPWMYEFCAPSESNDERCALRVRYEKIIPVTVETAGKDICRSPEDTVFNNTPRYIRSFVPEEPLEPGQTYILECDGPDGDYLGARVVVKRKDTAASVSPGILKITAAEHTRESEGCCGVVDYLKIRFDGLSGSYLDEGGYVEIAYPNGEVTVVGIAGPNLELPWVDGTILFTPVASDGERGDTINFDTDEAFKRGNTPCAVDDRGESWLWLWLFGPLVWVGNNGRSRERS